MNRRNFFKASAAVLLGGTVSNKPSEQEIALAELREAEDRFFAEQRRLEDAAIADYERVCGHMREDMIAQHVIAMLEELS